MKCPNCGLENPDSATVCQCGYSLVAGKADLEKSLAKQAQEIREEVKKIQTVDPDIPREEISTIKVDSDAQVDTDEKPKPKGVKQVLSIALGILFILVGVFLLLGSVLNLIEEGVDLTWLSLVLIAGIFPIIGGVLILRVSRTQRKVLLAFLGTLLLVTGGYWSAVPLGLIAEEGLTEGWTFYLLDMVVIGILPMIGGLFLYRKALQKDEGSSELN